MNIDTYSKISGYLAVSNSFLVRSQKVEDLNFIVHMFVDFKRSFGAEEGIAEFFEKNVPAGNYEIVVEGKCTRWGKESKD